MCLLGSTGKAGSIVRTRSYLSFCIIYGLNLARGNWIREITCITIYTETMACGGGSFVLLLEGRYPIDHRSLFHAKSEGLQGTAHEVSSEVHHAGVIEFCMIDTDM